MNARLACPLSTCLSALLLILLPASSALSQTPPQPVRRTLVPPGAPVVVEKATEEAKTFSLDFAGGPVQAFVDAVEKAMAEPFNVIIPESGKDLKIPAVRVREVTLSPLLQALSETSQQSTPVSQGGMIQYLQTGFMFTPVGKTGGNQVWQLAVTGIQELPMSVEARFYQIKPSLEEGLKVEDITTVAQTAWTMMKLDEAEIPELKLHEETGILIAVGSEKALAILDNILIKVPSKDGSPLLPATRRRPILPANPQTTPTPAPQ